MFRTTGNGVAAPGAAGLDAVRLLRRVVDLEEAEGVQDLAGVSGTAR